MRARKKKWALPFIEEHQELLYNKDEKLDLPVTLEIGIGKGDFILQHAKDKQDQIHIGVEINTSIFAIAMKKIVNEGLTNIRLLNADAIKLNEYINNESVDELYLNFSDPWPQNGYRKRRLVHPVHLNVFESLLKNNGSIFFKTDNLQLFEMGVKNFKERNYQISFLSYDYNTVNGDYISEYEARFRSQGLPIYRIVGKVNKDNLHPWSEDTLH